MSWLRRTIGLDAFELLLQTAVTAVLLFVISMTNSHEDAIVGGSVITIASLVVLGIRRQLALRKAERAQLPREQETALVAELEQRVSELEEDRHRLAELEERLDFTERLLAKTREPFRELAP